MRKVVLVVAIALVLVVGGFAGAWFLLRPDGALPGQEVAGTLPQNPAEPSAPVRAPETAAAYGMSAQEFVVTRARSAHLGKPKKVGDEDRLDAFSIAVVTNTSGGDSVKALSRQVHKALVEAKVLTRAQPMLLLDHDPSEGTGDLWAGLPVPEGSKVPDSVTVRRIPESRVFVSEPVKLSQLTPEKLQEIRRRADALGTVRFPVLARLTSSAWEAETGNDTEVQMIYPVQ